jgi:curli biogenesis system outer membrane secretion channel CsgG
MKNITTLSIAFAAALALFAAAAQAQPAAPQGTDTRAKVAMAEVKATPTLVESVAAQGTDKRRSLGRVLESIDGRVIDALTGTRKFRVIARSDLDALFKEQNFTLSGNVNEGDARAAQSFKIAGVDWLLVTTVDDFQDFEEVATFAGTGEQAKKRVIRLGVSAKIYDATSGEVKESVALQLGPGDPDYKKLRDISDVRGYSKTDGDLSDALLVKASQIMADRVANRVVDVIYPAKIIAKTGKQVTINRGDGTGIAVGQTWNVYALGQAMIDPDTGISLGAEEVKVGSVKVTDVQPLFSRGEILEDLGVDKLQVLRQAVEPVAGN